MAPAPVIDASAGRVRLGGDAYPFELDCATARATLSAGTERWTVRPLRWREKVTLARLSASGAGFVAEQLLRACLDGAEPPADPGVRAAVAALTSWIDGPADALPLTTPALATVTLELSRALGCRPSDLDRIDALEVEALWRAARHGQPAEAEQEDGVTRILVVPDPEPAGAPQDAPAPVRAAGPRFHVLDEAGTRGGAPEHAGAGATRVTDAAAPEELGADAAAPRYAEAFATGSGAPDANSMDAEGPDRRAAVATATFGAGALDAGVHPRDGGGKAARPSAGVASGDAGADEAAAPAGAVGAVPGAVVVPGKPGAASPDDGPAVGARRVAGAPRAMDPGAGAVAPPLVDAGAGAFGAVAPCTEDARAGAFGAVAPLSVGAGAAAFGAVAPAHVNAPASAFGPVAPRQVEGGGTPLVAGISSFGEGGTGIACRSRDAADELERDLDALCEGLAVRLEEAVEHVGVLSGA